MRRVCLQGQLLPCSCAYSGHANDRSTPACGQAGVWAKLTEVKWRRWGWGWLSIKVRSTPNLRSTACAPWRLLTGALTKLSCITSLRNLAMVAQRISGPDNPCLRSAPARRGVLRAGAGPGAQRHQAAGRQPHVAALLLCQRRH